MSEPNYANAPLPFDDDESPTVDAANIRKVWHNGEWYFSVIDIIGELLNADYNKAKNYWKVLKHRLKAEGNETVTKCHQLKLLAADGKMRSTDVVNTEQALRLIQSIPSPKAEPFKLWLARVGAERLEETQAQDPREAAQRARFEREYQRLIAEGFTPGEAKQWLEARDTGKRVRLLITEEWAIRGISTRRNFAHLTNETTEVALGKTATELKRERQIKGSLRDYEAAAALVALQITEVSATALHQQRDSLGVEELSEDIQDVRPIIDAARPEIDRVFSKKVRRLRGQVPPLLP